MTERREPPPEPDDPATGLVRRLGFGSAVSIGLGSMIGAGVFAVVAPAAAVAGSGLLLGLIVAGAVALCNALSSAQLAAQFPTSGGSYAYGRAVLGEWPGFLAGWTFVIGKVASSAAMALTFATYLAPPGWVRPLAVVAVIALTVVNCLGVTRTATLAKVLVALSLVALAVVVTIGLGAPAPADAGPWSAPGERWTVHGVLQSAGLLFFAFAGYARIATMGEEVIAPSQDDSARHRDRPGGCPRRLPAGRDRRAPGPRDGEPGRQRRTAGSGGSWPARPGPSRWSNSAPRPPHWGRCWP
ncbi:MAG: APC family permease [Micropruina sp.]